MAAFAPITIDQGLSGSDKIKALFNIKGIKLADADRADASGKGDGLITRDELSNFVRGNVSALDLDAFGGMDGLKSALEGFANDKQITDEHAYDLQEHGEAAKTDQAPKADANAENEDLKKQLADLQDQLKKLQGDQDHPHRRHHHHHHHHPRHGLFGRLGFLGA